MTKDCDDAIRRAYNYVYCEGQEATINNKNEKEISELLTKMDDHAILNLDSLESILGNKPLSELIIILPYLRVGLINDLLQTLFQRKEDEEKISPKSSPKSSWKKSPKKSLRKKERKWEEDPDWQDSDAEDSKQVQEEEDEEKSSPKSSPKSSGKKSLKKTSDENQFKVAQVKTKYLASPEKVEEIKGEKQLRLPTKTRLVGKSCSTFYAYHPDSHTLLRVLE